MDDNDIKTIFDAPGEDEQEPDNSAMGSKAEGSDE